MYLRKTANSTFKQQHRLCNSAGWKHIRAGAVQSHLRLALCYANMAPNLASCFSPPKSYACTRAPPSLFRPYAYVILLEKHNFIKLGEKPNCLKIGSGRAPAPRSVCEAFRGFRQLRVFPQAIANQVIPSAPFRKITAVFAATVRTVTPAHAPLH